MYKTYLPLLAVPVHVPFAPLLLTYSTYNTSGFQENIQYRL